MTTEKAPSKQAMAAGLKLFGALYRVGPEVSVDDEDTWVPIIAAALEAFAAERIADRQHACQFRDAVVRLAADRDALRACTTCDGQPHASGNVCICGGSGLRTDETLNLRQEALALRARNVALVALAHTVADKYDIYTTESFIDTAMDKHRAPTTHARLELSEAVDAMLDALAADAKAGEDRDG